MHPIALAKSQMLSFRGFTAQRCVTGFLNVRTATVSTMFRTEGGAEIHLKFPQDIASASGDALVSSANIFLCGSTNTEYWLHKGRRNAETSITTAAGEGLLQELSAFATLNPESNIRAEYGKIYRTEPHNLKAFNFILHAVTPKYVQGFSEEQKRKLHGQLKACYTESMRITVEQLGANAKLCLPLLGCGINDWPIKLSAQLLIEALEEQETSSLCVECSFIEERAYLETKKALTLHFM